MLHPETLEAYRQMTPSERLKLTLEMTARIQGFPSDWKFSGRKTAAYRQIGNAFPPPVAQAIGVRIKAAFEAADALRPQLRAVI